MRLATALDAWTAARSPPAVARPDGELAVTTLAVETSDVRPRLMARPGGLATAEDATTVARCARVDARPAVAWAVALSVTADASPAAVARAWRVETIEDALPIDR